MAIFTENELMKKYRSKIKSFQSKNQNDEALLLKNAIENENSFCSYDLLIKILDKCAENNKEARTDLDEIEEIYREIVITEKNDVDVSVFLRLLDFYFDYNKNTKEVAKTYRLFNDKSIFMGVAEAIIPELIQQRDLLLHFVYNAKPYCVDETMFYALFRSVVSEFAYKNNYDDIVEKHLEIARKNAGEIDIDSASVNEAIDKLEGLYTSLEDLEKEISVLKQDYTGMKTLTENKTRIVSSEIEKAIEKATKTLNDIAQSEEKALSLHKSELSKLTESFRSQIKDLGTDYINKIKAAVSEDPEAALASFEESNVPKTPYNMFLDKSVPLKERMKGFNAKKDKNEVYHQSMDDLAEQVFLGKTPYLVGPSGVGKTKSVEQFGKLIGLPVYNLGYVKDENETILGYYDINGNFVKTNFYDIYKNGGIIFFDEVDNSLSNALIIMDSVVDTVGYKTFLFKNGERLEPSENLVIVLAGNTYGDGTSEQYTEREKQSDATMDRIEFVKYDYDPKVEAKMMENCLDFHEFAVAYRESYKERLNADVITYRALISAKMDIENGIDVSKPLERRFIKNIKRETLVALSNLIEKKLAQKHVDDQNYKNETLQVFNKMIGK